MPNSPNTGVTHIEQSQSSKEVTSNAGVDRLSEFMAATLSKTITGDVVLSETETLEAVRFVLGGTPGAAFDFDLEDAITSGDSTPIRKGFIVKNDSGQTATVRVSDGAGGAKGATVAIPTGKTRELYTDGTDITAVAPEADAAGGGAVTSVFGRTGAVVAAASDYDAVQVDNTPAGGIAATDVQGAIDELDNEKAAAADLTAHTGDTGNPHSVTKSQVGLGNVEDLKVNLTATTDPGTGDDNTQGYAVGSRWINVTADKAFVCLDASTAAAVWTETTGAGGGGEANLGANVGTGGVGVFKDKTGVTLNFKKINAGSSKVTITDDTGNDEVDVDVVEANLDIGNQGGVLANDSAHGARGGGTQHAAATTSVNGFMASADKTKLDGVEAAADVTDAANVNAAGAVMETDFNAFTVLAADTDDTPAAVSVAASTVVGRKATGGVVAMTAAETRAVLNVEDGADVTDAANVDAAGALMQGKHTVVIPSGAMIAAITNGADGPATKEAATNDVNRNIFAFDAATEEALWFWFRAPKSADETVAIKANGTAWEEDAGGTSHGIAWGFSMLARGNGEAMDTAPGTEVIVTDTGGASGNLYIAGDSGNITPGGTWAEGDWLGIKVARKVGDAGDTLDVDGWLVGFALLIEINAADDA